MMHEIIEQPRSEAASRLWSNLSRVITLRAKIYNFESRFHFVELIKISYIFLFRGTSFEYRPLRFFPYYLSLKMYIVLLIYQASLNVDVIYIKLIPTNVLTKVTDFQMNILF